MAGLVPTAGLAASTINLSFSPPTINPGDPSNISISIYNSGFNALGSAAITVNLASGVTIASSPAVSDSCGFSSVSAPGGGSRLILTGGTVPAAVPGGADGSCTISVAVDSTGPGNHTTMLPANGPSGGFTPGGTVSGYSADDNGSIISNGTAASATLAVNTLSAPTGSMTFTPASVPVGETSVLAITLTNSNAGVTLPLTSFTDTLPAGMVLAAAPAGSVNCTGTGAVNGTLTSATPSGGGALTAGDSVLTLTGGTIGNGGSCTIQVTVAAPATSGTATNTAAANAIGNTRGLTSASFTRNLTVTNPLAITQATTPAAGTTVRAGQAVTLRITITNASANTPLDIVSFTDNLAAGLVVNAGISPTVSCTGTGAANGTLTATAGGTVITLASATAGKSGNCLVTVGVSMNAAGTLASTSATTVPNGTQITTAAITPANLTVPSSTVSVTAASAFTIAKSASPTSAYPGQAVTYTVTISNWSAGAASAVSFTDTLPTSNATPMVFAAGSALGTGCSGGTFTATAGATTATWTGGTIAAGSGTSAGTCTISLVTSMPAGASPGWTYLNSLPVTTAVTGTNISSGAITNTNAASATVTTVASVTVAQAFQTTPILQGATSQLRVTITNPTAGNLTNTTFTETLNANVVIAATPAISTTCSGTPVLTAVAGTGSFSVSGLTVTAGGNCRVSVNTTSTVVSAVAGWTSTLAAGAIGDDQGLSNSAAASAGLRVNSALTATAAFSPATVGLNGTSRLTLTMTNGSTLALTSLSVTDPLQTGGNAFVVAATPNASTTCTGSPVITANAGATSVTMTGGALAANSSCTLAFDIRTTAGSTWTNTIPIGNIISSEGASNTSAVTASASNSLAVAAAFSPASTGLGGSSRLTLTLANSGAVTFNNLSFTAPMQSGGNAFVLAATPNASSTCAGGPSLTATGGAASLVVSGATLAAGTNCTVSVDVVTTAGGAWTFTLPANSVTTTEGATYPTSVTAALGKVTGTIGVNKSFNPISIIGGSSATLQIDLTNPAGASTAVNAVSLTDTLPSGMEVYSVPNAHTTCTNGTITAAAGATAVVLGGADIGIGATCSVFVNVTSTKPLNLTNTIAIGAIGSRQGFSNSVATSASLSTLQGVGVEKSFSPMAISPGQAARLTIKLISTLNSVALSNVAVTDTLPSGVVMAASPNPSSTCNTSPTASGGGGTVAISGVAIAPQSNCSFAVDVTAASTGNYTNTIAIGGVTSTEGYSNQSAATASLTVMSAPTVGVAFATSPIQSGASSTLIVTLTNTSTQPLSGVALSDTLPSGLSIALTPSASTTCTGGSVVATAAGSSLSVSGASIAANGSCTFRADVTSNTAATYTNTIASGALTTTQGASNTSTASASLVVLHFPTVTQAISPASIAPGASSTLTLTLGNSNATVITLSSIFTLNLPTSPGNLVVANPNGLSSTCPGSVTANVGAASISYASGASIPAGGCTIGVEVTASTLGTYTSTIPAGTLQTSAGNSQSVSTAALLVTSSAPPTANDFSASVNDTAATPQAIGPLSGSATAPATLTTYTIRSLTNASLGSLYCNGTLVASVPANCAANQVAFLPVAAAVGTTSFIYTVTDSNAATSANATGTITVNGAPSAAAISASINNDAVAAIAVGPLSGTPQGSATLASYAITSLPGAALQVYCNAVLVTAVPTTCAANQVTVLPVAAPIGSASFHYTVTDSNGMTSPAATVTVTFNAPPAANAITLAINNDRVTAAAVGPLSGTPQGSATITGYTLATLPGATLAVYCNATLVSSVPAACAANQVSVLPLAAPSGTATFTYTDTDSHGMTSPAATITVHFNTPPTANAVTNPNLSSAAVTPQALAAMSGAATTAGATLTSYHVAGLPVAGTLYCSGVAVAAVPTACAANGLGYLPAGPGLNPVTFTYTVTDSNAMTSAAATFSIPLNSAPSAADFSATINDDVPAAVAIGPMSGTPLGGATIASYTLLSLPTGATLFCSGTAVATVPASCAANGLTVLPVGLPGGTSTLTYRVTDSNSLQSAAATGTIHWNTRPTATALAARLNATLLSAQPLPTLVGAATTAGATVASYRVVSLPPAGKGTLQCAGSTVATVPAACAPAGLALVPASGASGTTSFDYVSRDSNAQDSLAATVTVTLGTPPQAGTLTMTDANPQSPTPVTVVTLVGTATTPGATITGFTVGTLPATGTLYCNAVAIGAVPAACAANALTYKPATGASGSVSFSYTVTDSDGLHSAPATVTIVLASSPALTITKKSAGPMTSGFDARYTLQALNKSPGTATTAPVTITDTLPAGLDYLSAGGASAPSAWTCTWTAATRTLQCVSPALIPANGSAQAITLHVRPNATALGNAATASLANAATVAGGGELPSYADGSAPGAQPHSATDTQTVQKAALVSGSVWVDLNANGLKDPGEPSLAAGSVRVEAWPAGTTTAQAHAGTPLATTLIDAAGRYVLTVPPGNVQIRFVDVTGGANMGSPVNGETAGSRNQPGQTGSSGVVHQGVIDNVEAAPGAAITQQSLPIDPQGYVYDSTTRLPIGGASVTLLANGGAVAIGCLNGGANPFTTTGSGAFAGGYQFLLDFAASGCTALSGATFSLSVTAAGFQSPSTLIAPGMGGSLVLHTPSGSGAYAVVSKATIPTGSDPTTYYLGFVLGTGRMGITNNDVPLDGLGAGSLAISKTASKSSAEIGDLLRYTVTVRNAGKVALPAITVADQLPLGFAFVPQSASISTGAAPLPLAAKAAGPNLDFTVPALAPGAVASLQYLVRVGVGAERGDGINRAQASVGSVQSAVASAQVRVSAGVFGAEACVAGKVFRDCNANGIQDRGEPGVRGVRLWMETGVSIITDAAGRYSLCGITPRTHSIHLDRQTLPPGTAPLITSRRNLGDAASLLLDAHAGELDRADFALGPCLPDVTAAPAAGSAP